MLSLERMRKRLPLIAFVLLVLILVMLVGIACACATDHPMQAIEKAPSANAAAPALIELWSLMVALLVPASFFVAMPRREQGRASPPLLQCFLF